MSFTLNGNDLFIDLRKLLPFFGYESFSVIPTELNNQK
jgi:hypothetical protein